MTQPGESGGDNVRTMITLYVTEEQLEALTDALDFAFHNDPQTPLTGEAFDDIYDKLVTAAGEANPEDTDDPTG
jgi:hypothetical protein